MVKFLSMEMVLRQSYTFEDIIDGIVKSIQYLEQNEGVYEILNLEDEMINLKEMLSAIENAMQKKSNLNRMPLAWGCQKTNADIEKAKILDWLCSENQLPKWHKIYGMVLKNQREKK